MSGPAATQANPAVITRAQRNFVVFAVMKCKKMLTLHKNNTAVTLSSTEASFPLFPLGPIVSRTLTFSFSSSEGEGSDTVEALLATTLVSDQL